ncbi:DNA-binding transcriptional MerR regulator [Thermocatellispora tengchongensis]|uniref:DNA-binding transcriptional MerR regulator n=1 Tax=Thermocatellispora tengchongensis TaxID=1073253 RepID=A0A840PN29_9ACTN|nr:MerR family transcriptional regulator [Thermocatellispora tengchongensis]MBB5140296.1 DNA-binding transcriptional MerR regulator [Thermocatellispora tengchongensis]
MRIGELAAATGVSVRALRYYEEQKLLSPTRSPSGQRHYSDASVARVLQIQQLYAAGLSSKTILRFLPYMESNEVTTEVLHRLRAERERIDKQISALLETRDRLDRTIANAVEIEEQGGVCPHWP